MVETSGHDDRKLVAPQATREPTLVAGLAETIGDLPQHVVTCRMAERVVDALEPSRSMRSTQARCQRTGLRVADLEHAIEFCSIGKPGQTVGPSLAAQRFLHQMTIADILNDADQGDRLPLDNSISQETRTRRHRPFALAKSVSISNGSPVLSVRINGIQKRRAIGFREEIQDLGVGTPPPIGNS